MDTRMLDVAIGLVMVFAVASLLATAIQEMWASASNARGKNLKTAIASMGNDDPLVADAIFGHPLVQSLILSERKLPSYLPADVFSTALLGVIAKGASIQPRQGTPLEFLSALALPPGSPQGFGQLKDVLQSLVAGVENDWPAFEARIQAWYYHTGERSIGWFKRSTQQGLFLIGLTTAVLFNIDSIAIGDALWNDKALRERSTTMAVQLVEKQSAKNESDVAKPPSTTATSPASPTTPAVAAPSADQKRDDGGRLPLTPLQQAINEVLARVGRDFSMIKEHASTPTLRSFGEAALADMGRLQAALHDERMVRGSVPAGDGAQSRLVEVTDERLAALTEKVKAIDGVKMSSIEHGAVDSLRLDIAKTKDLLSSERRPPEATTKSAPVEKPGGCDTLKGALAQSCTRSCSGLSGGELASCAAQVRLYAVKDIGIPIGWTDEQRSKLFDGPVGVLSALIGWLVTAIAVTLGAPFWFDLLGKLVKLRGSGPKAAAEGGASNDGSPSTPSVSAPSPATQPAQTGEASSDALNDDEHKLSASEIQRIQIALRMPNEKISSRLDMPTRNAISDWQISQKLAGTGELTGAQIQCLLYGGTASAGVPSTLNDAGAGTVYEG